MHADTDRRLSTYRPAIVEPCDRGSFERFARATFSKLGQLAHGTEMGRARVMAIAATWAKTAGVSLVPEVVFHPDNIELCADWWKRLGRHDGDLRWGMRTISRDILPDLWPTTPSTRNQRTVAPPYTPDEVSRLERDAEAQRTAPRERRAKTILLAGMACGLRSQHLRFLCGGHVISHNGVTGIVVAETGVFVPALDRWADPLAAYAARFDPDQRLLTDREPTKNFLSNCNQNIDRSPGTPRFVPSRFRSTWLLAHIEAGTRLPELLEAAHLQTLTQINQLLPYVTRLDPVTTAGLLAHGPGDRL